MNRNCMYSIILLILLFITVSPAIAQKNTVAKDSISFAEQYLYLKKIYIQELKKDSFLVTIPVVSENFFKGEVEIKPGVKKIHLTKSIRTVEEWRYPPFDQKQFELWLLKYSNKIRANKSNKNKLR